jgi:asparagine synthase (glutamine-hydrolysing)
LDVAVFDFAATLPDHLLTDRRQGKLILREMLKDKLPVTVLNHPKTGLSTPLHQYWNDDFRHLAYDLIVPPGPLDAVLNKELVLWYLRNGLSQTRDNAHTTVFRSTHQLWLLVQLYGWVHRFKVTV